MCIQVLYSERRCVGVFNCPKISFSLMHYVGLRYTPRQLPTKTWGKTACFRRAPLSRQGDRKRDTDSVFIHFAIIFKSGCTLHWFTLPESRC